MTQKTLLKNL